MKKAYTLLLTLLLLLISSFILVNIMQVKSLNEQSLFKKYEYIQAKNHLRFLEQLVKKEEFKNSKSLSYKDDDFFIEAKIVKTNNKKIAHLFIASKNTNTKLHKSFIIK